MKLKSCLSIGLLAAFILLSTANQPRAELPPEAQGAVKKGIIAAQQEDYPLAARFFQEAYQQGPHAPEIYGYLGMAEAKIPGRELRAIAWFGAYLAANPKAANAAAVKEQIDILDVKSQSNISRLIQMLEDAALQIPPDTAYNQRNVALQEVSTLWANSGDFTAAQNAMNLISQDDMRYRGYAKDNIACARARLAAERGDIDGAKRAARQIESPYTRGAAEGYIAAAQAEAGDIAGAQSTLALITDNPGAHALAEREIDFAQQRARENRPRDTISAADWTWGFLNDKHGELKSLKMDLAGYLKTLPPNNPNELIFDLQLTVSSYVVAQNEVDKMLRKTARHESNQ